MTHPSNTKMKKRKQSLMKYWRNREFQNATFFCSYHASDLSHRLFWISSFMYLATAKICIEIDIGYAGHDLFPNIENIDSWEVCRDQCENTPACFAWCWIPNQCGLKKASWASGRTKHTGAISGKKNCKGELTFPCS